MPLVKKDTFLNQSCFPTSVCPLASHTRTPGREPDHRRRSPRANASPPTPSRPATGPLIRNPSRPRGQPQ